MNAAGLSAGLQTLASVVMALMVIAALLLLWRRDKSVWLLVALVGEFVGLAFRLAMAFVPDLMRTMPQVFSLWTLSALVFAVGLLGYAIEATTRR
jgi:hypothetical protein